METVTKNYGGKHTKSRRTGDAWWKQGRAVFPFLSLRDREPVLEVPPATPPQDQAALPSEALASVPPAAAPPNVPEPALAPEVLARAEAVPKPPYKAGDLMREEDYDSSRLPKGCSFGHGRITRTQRSDRPPDVLPEVWSSLTKSQKRVLANATTTRPRPRRCSLQLQITSPAPLLNQ